MGLEARANFGVDPVGGSLSLHRQRPRGWENGLDRRPSVMRWLLFPDHLDVKRLRQHWQLAN
jgi:hypothetical protein